MAENTAVAEKKEAESRELVAKDFTEGMVVKIKQKEKFGLTFPKDYNYTNELMSAMLILQDTQDMNKKPVLQSCTRASIENALIEMVTDGLSIRKKQCYPVAYAGKLSCQPSVYGATCLARRYGLKDINAYNLKIVLEFIDEYFEIVESDKQTNADRIRNMSDEELAEFNLCPHMVNWKKGNYDTCIHPNDKDACKKCMLDWLQSEAE